MVQRARVVVVGAGFAGLAAARELARSGALVTLVDRNPYATFQPLLYQVATAGMGTADVSYPIRTYAAKWPNVRARRAALSRILPEKRRVELDDGGALDYDYLVLATGVTTNWLNVPGAPENALPIYSLGDAAGLRRRLQHYLEDTATGRRESTHVVVVGAGATGVEMAGTLAELRRNTLPLTHPEVRPDQTSVTLVERFDYVLAPYKPKLRDSAAQALRKRGVRLRLGATVAGVEPDAVLLEDGTRLDSDVTVWALGVTAPPEVASWGLEQGKGGRITVTEALNVPGHPEIFVAGDLAGAPHALPQLAQPAIQMGKHVGKQIAAMVKGGQPRPFSYRDPGIMATVGKAEAVLQLENGLTMRGLPAWLVWIFIHVAYLLGGRNRLSVLLNFFWRYAGPHRSRASVTQ
ncbi:NAD(P)/FAD-dependent oxidoreductase [Nonomuraea gerenzanensis]|uniref:NADH dehydrogenase n=1 Tax=Nonomuraea gerenzanensis TaxID=93944 RepID=A0A1M4EMY1_9ACTN|nr:NAD(P)/FAD-dependent oxidoreductase [Nonomuraea gerenzanensis]UBU11716.1 NAD(P)/FAD-dependent oxidoreductase [Nonomuraea gerenzanensis]SBP00216.1 NADH dehydrogenase [Nonomuraea gerenzanensis]